MTKARLTVCKKGGKKRRVKRKKERFQQLQHTLHHHFFFCFPFTSLITIIKATLGKWKLERKAVLTSYWHRLQMLRVIFLPAICTSLAIPIVP